MKKLFLVFFISFFLLNEGLLVIIEAQNTNNACVQGQFDADCLFPTWDSKENPGQVKDAVVQGVIGANQDGGFLMNYIPKIINILLKFVAPIVTLMLIWTGILFMIAGSDDDDLGKAKNFFTYSVIGVGFIVLSYSILKFVYFFLAKG